MHGGGPVEWLPAEPLDAPCPVCGGVSATALLTVANPYTPGQLLPFARCGSCASVFLSHPQLHISHDAGLDDAAFLTWYLETGAGIDAMLQPLLALPMPRGGTFLDVGCGFGFSTWYASEHLGMRAVGLERAPYGARGRHLLGADIRPEYVGEPCSGTIERFEVVHCSEVIEHVEDPRAFLCELRARCDERGLLIMTTPDADVIRPETPGPVIVEALSPGLHRILLNRQHLQLMLEEAGFPVQRVVQNGGHLVVWASSIPLPEPRWAAVDSELYIAVLTQLARFPDAALRRGSLYRLLRHHVTEGHFRDAEVVLEDLTSALADGFGARVLSLSGPLLDDHLESNAAPGQPSFLGPLYYWLGMLATHSRSSDVATRTRLFADALTLLSHAVQTRPQYAHEDASLVEAARFHLLQVALQTAVRELPPALAGPFCDRARTELRTATALMVPTDQSDLVDDLMQP